MSEIFAGRYELIDPIAVGGMGTVWCVRDLKDGEVKAAKILQQSDAALLLRFMREQTMRFDHSHVVTPESWAGMDDKVLFTMPLLRGGSVSELLKQHPTGLSPRWVSTIVEQVLLALEAVHGAGIVHRDIKPANLLLEPTGIGRPHVRLTDFGIAVPLDEPRMTRASVVIGTPGYMAPEQLRGADPDIRSDIYSAGRVGLELLTGVRPSSNVGTDPAAAVSADRPGYDQLVAVLRRAVAADPADRFQTAEEMRRTLASLNLSVLPPEPGEHIEIIDRFPELDAPATRPPGTDLTDPDAPTGVGSGSEPPTRVSTHAGGSTRVEPAPVPGQAGGRNRPNNAVTALLAVVGLICLIAALLLWWDVLSAA